MGKQPPSESDDTPSNVVSILPRLRNRSSPWETGSSLYLPPPDDADRRIFELAEEVDFLGYRLSAAERNCRVLLESFLRLEERVSTLEERLSKEDT